MIYGASFEIALNHCNDKGAYDNESCREMRIDLASHIALLSAANSASSGLGWGFGSVPGLVRGLLFFASFTRPIVNPNIILRSELNGHQHH
jgi:hypothetical protein